MLRKLAALLAYLAFAYAPVAQAQSIVVPLPTGCVPSLTQSAGNFTLTCSGSTGNPPPPPPPPPTGPISCDSLPGPTLVTPEPKTWPATQGGLPRIATRDFGHLFGNGSWVVPIAIPASFNGYFNVNAVEYDGPPWPRYGSVTLTPCDFAGSLPGGPLAQSGSLGLSFTINVGTFQKGTDRKGNPIIITGIAPGQTVYFNAATLYGACSPGPTCDMDVDVSVFPR